MQEIHVFLADFKMCVPDFIRRLHFALYENIGFYGNNTIISINQIFSSFGQSPNCGIKSATQIASSLLIHSLKKLFIKIRFLTVW